MGERPGQCPGSQRESVQVRAQVRRGRARVNVQGELLKRSGRCSGELQGSTQPLDQTHAGHAEVEVGVGVVQRDYPSRSTTLQKKSASRVMPLNTCVSTPRDCYERLLCRARFGPARLCRRPPIHSRRECRDLECRGSIIGGVGGLAGLVAMTEWMARPLEKVYAAVFIDAIYVKVRDGQVANRPFYAAIGVDLAGHKEVLGLWAGGPVAGSRRSSGCRSSRS